MNAAHHRTWTACWALAALAWVALPSFAGGEVGPPRPQRRDRPEPRRPASSAAALRESPANAATAGAPTAGSRLEVLSGAGGSKTIAMEFYGLDIDHLLRLLSHAAQVTIVKSEQVTGPITIIAPEPVPLGVAFQILDSVLQVRGFTMVRTPTGIYKVIPMGDAIQSGLPVEFGAIRRDAPPGDELITQVIPLRNLSAAEVAGQLQGFLSQTASIIPTGTNSLIVTDTAANVHRALSLIDHAEGELAGGVRVYPLQYYDATEMADLVTSIVLSRGAAGGIVGGPRPTWERRVVGRGAQQQPGRPTPRAAQAQPAATAGTGPEFAYPDTRTNSLIVLATPLHHEQIGELVAQLDRRVSLRDSYFVYPVQNLVASQLAESIAPLIGAQVTQAGSQATTTAAQRTGRIGLQTDQRQTLTRPFTTGLGTTRQGFSADTSRLRTRGASELPLEIEPLAGAGGLGADRLLIAQAADGLMPGQVVPVPEPSGPAETALDLAGPAQLGTAGVAQAVVVADDNTNTLLISAAPEQIDLVEQMLAKLDVLPPQVHIRAIIAEVQLGSDTSLGFDWQRFGLSGAWRDNPFTADVGTGFGGQRPDTTKGTVPTGLFGTISMTINESTFSAVLNALTTDSRARILSAPSIFTANNQKATIDVSEQLPFPTGTFQTTLATETISTSISYRSVGIVLDVTPRVTQGDIVQMEVAVSANDPGGSVAVAGVSYPTFSQRLAQASLSVRNGETVVMGGLMKERIEHTGSRVPLLGNLPLIGPLFRSTQAVKQKSELLVFLTPQITRTSAEVSDLVDRETSRLPDVPKSLRRPPAERVEPAVEAPIRMVEPPARPSIEAPPVEPEAPAQVPPVEEEAAPEIEPAPQEAPAGEAPAAEQPAPTNGSPEPVDEEEASPQT